MHIRVIPKWGFENESGQSLHGNLLPILDGINRTGRLTQAAKGVGVSYRHAWNLLRDSEAFFGSPLVILEKGRGATLLPLGLKLLRINSYINA